MCLMDGAAGGGDREVKKEFFHKVSVEQRLKQSEHHSRCNMSFLGTLHFLSLLDLTNVP